MSIGSRCVMGDIRISMQRTAAEGGKVFTVCEACWDKHYAKPENGGEPAASGPGTFNARAEALRSCETDFLGTAAQLREATVALAVRCFEAGQRSATGDAAKARAWEAFLRLWNEFENEGAEQAVRILGEFVGETEHAHHRSSSTEVKP